MADERATDRLRDACKRLADVAFGAYDQMREYGPLSLTAHRLGAAATSAMEAVRAASSVPASDELLDWLSDVGDFLGCLKLADPTRRDELQARREQLIERIEAPVVCPTPQGATK